MVYTKELSHTEADARSYLELAASLQLTDFNPLVVDWQNPVPWYEDGGCEMSDSSGCLMPLSAGFGIVLGFGAFFSIFTTILVKLESAFGGVTMTSEHFNTAGRDVKTGLTASVIVSQWTWAATLLQSSNVAWQYGISGPFWYAAGASIQVLLFGVLAIEVKRKAPTCHTFLEMVKVRWGKPAHFTFIFFAFCTNILVTSMLILGGADCMSATSGMDKVLAGFLIPLGVIAYTVAGGLKATFLASYVHTSIIFVGLVTFVTYTYGVNRCPTEFGTNPWNNSITVDGVAHSYPDEQCNNIGSASVMYERLMFVQSLPINTANGTHHGPPVLGTDSLNHNGAGVPSYLTMLSAKGLMFGIINVVGNFGTVFVDQSYWQSAIAASPAASHKGYLMGGLVWFTIPFALATSLGLSGIALNVRLTGAEAGRGLVPPAAATVMIGNGGGVFMIMMLFMAITSTGSAECIAVSSLVAYDIYREYINPNATGQDILRVSRIVIVIYGLISGCLSAILLAFDIGLGWVYNFMGIIIGSAVFPVAMLILDNRLPAVGAMTAAWTGMICALCAWMIVADAEYKAVNVDTLGTEEAQLAGNVTAIFSSVIICFIFMLTKPQNFNWGEFKEKIKLIDDQVVDIPSWEMSDEFLDKAKAWIVKYGVNISLVLIFAWPMATIPFGVLPKAVYNLWAALAFMWGWVAAIAIIGLPIYENRATFVAVMTCNPIAKKDTKTAEVEAAPISATSA